MDSFLVKYLQSGKAWVLVGSGPSIEMGYPSWEQLASLAVELVTTEQRGHGLTNLNKAMKNRDFPAVFQEAQGIVGGPRLIQHLRDNNKPSTVGTYRLRAMSAPSKSGKIWNKHSVQAILKNPSYTGKTYVFTTAKGRKQFTRPQEDWIEINGATPAIISQELFDAAQKQLALNRQKTVPTTKHEYLLRGHIRCRQCGRAYVSGISVTMLKDKRYIQRRYRCTGKAKLYSPIERCCNKGWSANRLEAIVWTKLEEYLSRPELIVSELEKQRQDVSQPGVFKTELQQAERQLKAVDREQHQLLQWALKGFPEGQVEVENRRLNKARETLKVRKAELETQLKASQDAIINIPKLESFIEHMQERLSTLDFEGKRLALDMLCIKVWLDGENVEITGTIDAEVGVTQTTQV